MNESQQAIVESLTASQRLVQHYFAELAPMTDRATMLALGRMIALLADMLADVAGLIVATPDDGN